MIPKIYEISLCFSISVAKVLLERRGRGGGYKGDCDLRYFFGNPPNFGFKFF